MRKKEDSKHKKKKKNLQSLTQNSSKTQNKFELSTANFYTQMLFRVDSSN